MVLVLPQKAGSYHVPRLIVRSTVRLAHCGKLILALTNLAAARLYIHESSALPVFRKMLYAFRVCTCDSISGFSVHPWLSLFVNLV